MKDHAKAVTKRHKKKTIHVKARRHRTHMVPANTFVATSTSMSQAMVDRLFWRAGFGPTAQDRADWTGKNVTDAVDHLLSTPQSAPGGSAPTVDGKPLDPTNDDTQLVLSFFDRMLRAQNPFVERLTFFWHRHWHF